MTRKEEIEKEAVFRYPEMTSRYIAFIKGAKYADKTMLDRACEWLNKILYVHTEIGEDKDWCETNTTNWVTSDYDTVEEFITAFRQKMEGGVE